MPAQFQAPEQASIEYVVLDLDAVKKNIAVSEDDLRKYYAENEKRYTAPEERRASHILVKADKDAPKAERDKAQGQGRGAARRGAQEPAGVRRDREEELRRRGLGGQGRRPRLLRPRRDGQAVRGRRLRAEAGRDERHRRERLRLSTSSSVTGARGGEKKSFESVRAADRGRSRATSSRRSASPRPRSSSATSVYEQPDSLKPAADKWKLEMQDGRSTSTRAPAPGATGAARQPALPRGAVQQRRRRATSATPRRSTSARTSSPPAASSSTRRRTSCRSPRSRTGCASSSPPTQAAALAAKLGAERLAAARAAPADAVRRRAPLIVSRAQPRDLPRPLLDAVLKAPAATLPAFVGVPLGDQGYAVAKIIKIGGPRPGRRRSGQGAGAVRAGLGRRRGAGLLRRAEDRASR